MFWQSALFVSNGLCSRPRLGFPRGKSSGFPSLGLTVAMHTQLVRSSLKGTSAIRLAPLFLARQSRPYTKPRAWSERPLCFCPAACPAPAPDSGKPPCQADTRSCGRYRQGGRNSSGPPRPSRLTDLWRARVRLWEITPHASVAGYRYATIWFRLELLRSRSKGHTRAHIKAEIITAGASGPLAPKHFLPAGKLHHTFQPAPT